MTDLDSTADKLALESYRRGLVDAATLCRLKAVQQKGEGWLSAIQIAVHGAHMADAEALIELAQGLTELPQPK